MITLKDAVEKDLLTKVVIRALLPLVEKEDQELVCNYSPTEEGVLEIRALRKVVAKDAEAAGYMIASDEESLAEKARKLVERQEIDFSRVKVGPVLNITLSGLIRYVLNIVATDLFQQVDNLGVWFTNKANNFLFGAINQEAIERFVKEEQERIDQTLADFRQNHPWINIDGKSYEVSIGPRVTSHNLARPGSNKFGINFYTY